MVLEGKEEMPPMETEPFSQRNWGRRSWGPSGGPGATCRHWQGCRAELVSTTGFKEKQVSLHTWNKTEF